MDREVRYQLIVPEECGTWPLDRLLARDWETPLDGGIAVQVIAYFDSTGHHEFTRRKVLLFEVGPDEVEGVGPFARVVRAVPGGQVCFRIIDIAPHERVGPAGPTWL
jgi:hypothetical protein